MANITDKLANTFFRCLGIKLLAGAIAGLVAVAVHILLLSLAGVFQINVESGGLLQLLRLGLRSSAMVSDLASIWVSASLPAPGSLLFWIFFHGLTGVVLAIVYALVFEPYLPGSGLIKGAQYSLLPWLINSILVMPLLGNGFAGSEVLSLLGMMWFFVANTIFGILLGIGYPKFVKLFQNKSIQ